MDEQEAPSPTACWKHPERPAATTCDDCARPMCHRCEVPIPDIGTFCWECAARRGGLHHHRTARLRNGAPPARSAPPLVVDAGEQAANAVRQFELAVADREPHQLISGLTERLEEAGADPEDVVDDDEVFDEIARLQDLAAAPEPKRWPHR